MRNYLSTNRLGKAGMEVVTNKKRFRFTCHGHQKEIHEMDFCYVAAMAKEKKTIYDFLKSVENVVKYRGYFV